MMSKPNPGSCIEQNEATAQDKQTGSCQHTGTNALVYGFKVIQGHMEPHGVRIMFGHCVFPGECQPQS